MTEQQLVGYLRAEFARAARWRMSQFCVQLAAALPPALSVLMTDPTSTYWLAIASLVLLLTWAAVNRCYTRIRSAAHAARRATLLTGAFPGGLSPDAVLSFTTQATVSMEQAKKCEQADYYATRAPASARRLKEMIEESAFYSATIQRQSATVMSVLLTALVLIAGSAFLVTMPTASADANVTLFRIFLAGAAFALSSDVYGAMKLHADAACSIDRLLARLGARDKDDSLPDAMLAMSDYSAAVEGAPEAIPFIYRFKRAKLDERWKAYKQAREAAVALKDAAS
jgi:hypothetical protein